MVTGWIPYVLGAQAISSDVPSRCLLSSRPIQRQLPADLILYASSVAQILSLQHDANTAIVEAMHPS